MAAFHPFFRGQALKIQPDRTRGPLRHCGDVAGRNIAGEEFDHEIGQVARGKRAVLIAPMPHGDGAYALRFAVDRDFRANSLEAAQIVDPQSHGNAMLFCELSRQPPANADVAIVVDDFAEQGEGGGGRLRGHMVANSAVRRSNAASGAMLPLAPRHHTGPVRCPRIATPLNYFI